MNKCLSKFVFYFAFFFIVGTLVNIINADCAKFQERCSVFKKCCPGFTCHPFVQKCYHSPRQFGEPCMAGHECDTGLSCQAGAQKCYHVPRLYGEPCAFNNPCAPGLSCGEIEKKCYTNPRKENEPCDPASPCGANLECRDGKCQPPIDCSKCNSFPPLCNYVENCIKHCNLSPFQAENCYKRGYISLDKCKQLYPNCGNVDPCTNCKLFPPMCHEIDNCVKSCKEHPTWAESCYHYGYITKTKCLELYPQCKDLDPECKACLSFPGLCNTIEVCIGKCNLSLIQVQNCKNAGYITLEKCKQLNPDCK